jgi:hypothetical protein
MIAPAPEQTLVPSAACFHICYSDQRLRAHSSRVSIPRAPLHRGQHSTKFHQPPQYLPYYRIPTEITFPSVKSEYAAQA